MCSPKVKEIAYNSLIRPHLEYASAAWSPHTKRNIDKVEAVQRRAARFILSNYVYGSDSKLTSQIQSELHWIPLQHRRALYDLSLFFKIKHGLLNIKFPESVQTSVRHPHYYLHVKCIYSEAYLYHFYTRSVRLWNALPLDIVNIANLDVFKSQTSKWMLPLTWSKASGIWTLV